MSQKLYLIAAGMGEISLITEQAKKLIVSVDILYSTDRLSKLLAPLRQEMISAPFSELETLIRNSSAKTIGVLISGDTGFYSISKKLNESLKDSFDISFITGINSMQYFLSKLNMSYENINSISLHGRRAQILAPVSYNRYTFLLTGGENKAHDICKELSANYLSDVTVYAGENLSLENERIVKSSAHKLSKIIFSDLTVLLIENNEYVNCDKTLFDKDLLRGKAPMTKEEIRWVSVAAVDPKKTDTIFDIGAGTGSVAIELARRASNGVVYAIEHDHDACELIKENIKKTRSFNIKIIEDRAPICLEKLPVPDKVFIGGSSGEIKKIISVIIEKNSKAVITVNAITLETLAETLAAFKELGIAYTVKHIASAEAKKIGSYNMMTAHNPIYIITGNKDE